MLPQNQFLKNIKQLSLNTSVYKLTDIFFTYYLLNAEELCTAAQAEQEEMTSFSDPDSDLEPVSGMKYHGPSYRQQLIHAEFLHKIPYYDSQNADRIRIALIEVE